MRNLKEMHSEPSSRYEEEFQITRLCACHLLVFQNTVPKHLNRSDANTLHFVHRLDYSTSGVMCLAKNRQSAAKVGRLFVERCVKKYYIALIQGVPCSEVFDIDYDIGEDPTENEQHRMCARLPDVEQSRIPLKPRTARTKVLLLETGTYNGHDASCVLLKPITGRRHQLRVHLTSKGHPIVGDYTYANDTEPHRMFLHAMRLMLPLQDTPLDIETPNPFTSDEQFQKLWKSKNVLRPFHTAQERMEAFSFIDNLQ